MAKYSVTLSADTAGTKICDVNRPRAFYQWFGLLGAQGTFGSGTLTWHLSIDDGATLIPIEDLTGTPITQTANGAVTSSLPGGGNLTENVSIWVALASSTNPSIEAFVFDNN